MTSPARYQLIFATSGHSFSFSRSEEVISCLSVDFGIIGVFVVMQERCSGYVH